MITQTSGGLPAANASDNPAFRNPDGTYPPYTTIATRSAGVTSYDDTSVTPGAIHRYIIQACNASGCSNSPNVSVTVPAS